MRLFRGLTTVIASLCLLAPNTVDARSQPRQPINYLTLLEDPSFSTPSQRVHAHSSFDLQFSLHNKQQRIRLSLEPNHDILADDATVTFIDANGNIRHTEPIDRSQHKVFKGKTWVQDELANGWKHVGWARIVVTKDGPSPLFEGAFAIMHDHHHVQLRTHYMQTRHELDPFPDALQINADGDAEEYMVVYRDSDVGRLAHTEMKRSGISPETCEMEELSFNVDPQHPLFDGSGSPQSGASSWGSMAINSLLGKRQSDVSGSTGNSAGVNLTTTIGDVDGCPSTRKVALIGVAADCTYTASFNSSETARSNIITQVNSASDVYESTFNITLGLQNLTLSDAECPGTASAATPWNLACSDNTTLTNRLNLFSAWRGEHNDTNAYWTLLTDCSTGSEVGLAWLGQLCTQGSTSGSSTDGTTENVAGANVVARTSNEWQVIAHESGHTFGAVHDCTSSTCSDGTTVNSQQCCPLSTATCDADAQYIMNPSSNPGVTQFSPCTVGNICSAILRNSVKSTCLSNNKGVTTISGQQCGNGIVEDGEDCDCGGTDGCGDDACCDASTCKFKDSAVCDDANDDCCSSCQFSSAGTVCRASTGTCDPEETCSGSSAACPADATAVDGTSCSSSNGTGLTCASGQCTSRDQQCETLMTYYLNSDDIRSCDDSSCTISCTSSSLSANTCYEMQQNFLDGTPCTGGGTCQNGRCTGSSVSREITDWINDHKALVIGISVALGVMLLIALTSCCLRRYRTIKYRQNMRGGGADPKMMMGGPPGYYGGQQPPVPMAAMSGARRQHRSRSRSHRGGGSSTSGTRSSRRSHHAPLPSQDGPGGWNGPPPPPPPQHQFGGYGPAPGYGPMPGYGQMQPPPAYMNGGNGRARYA